MEKTVPGKSSSRRHPAFWPGVACAVVALAVTLLFFWSGEVQRLHQPIIFSSDPAAGAPPAFDLAGKKVIRILAINGGGVRGLIPTAVLAYLEKKTGRPAADLFDLFIGTSSGGIVTTGCLIPGENGKPRYTAEDISRNFMLVAPQIFDPSLKHTVLSLKGLLAPQFSSRKKDEAFRGVFGDVPYGHLLKPVFVTAYDIANQCPTMLANWLPEWSGYGVDAVLSAETTGLGVFDPVLLRGADGIPRMFTDLGLIENDPSSDVLDFVRKIAPDAKIIIVNLGTGRFLMNETAGKTVNMGELRLISELLPYLESGNVQETKRRMESEQAYLGTGRLVYADIDIDMPPGQFYHPYNGSAENLANVRSLGEKCVQANKAELDRLADLLTSQPH